MTKTNQSMIAAAIAGLAVLGAIGSASALPTARQSGSNVAPPSNVTTGTAANFGGPRHFHMPPCESNVCNGKTPAPNGKF